MFVLPYADCPLFISHARAAVPLREEEWLLLSSVPLVLLVFERTDTFKTVNKVNVLWVHSHVGDTCIPDFDRVVP